MKIVIPGGSGQIGTLLCRHLHAAGHDVVVLSRHTSTKPWRVVAWDGVHLDEWRHEIEGADVVINLAGRSVDCRCTAPNKRDILRSRVDSTRIVGEAIARAARPPRLWLQASTATIYAHRLDADNDEATGVIGGHEAEAPRAWDFSIEVATAWERACLKAPTPDTRKVLLRSAMTMSQDPGGVFDTLLRLVRFRLGGNAGSGRQYVSWIHALDFVRVIDWLIEHDDFEGVVNVAAPNPLPYSDFMRGLRAAAGVRIGLPAPAWLLAIGTFILRTESELVLKSRRVVPGRLSRSGFTFEYPVWAEAALDLVRRRGSAILKS